MSSRMAQDETFTSARQFFAHAREASRDAERIRRQLIEMESRADGLGSSGIGQRVRASA